MKARGFFFWLVLATGCTGYRGFFDVATQPVLGITDFSRHIVFATNVGSTLPILQIVRDDGSDYRVLWQGGGTEVVNYPRFSPDKTKILFSVRDTGISTNYLHLINSDGSGFSTLRQSATLGINGGYGPNGNWYDGTSYLFNEGGNSSASIYKSNLDGSNTVLFIDESIVAAPPGTTGIGGMEKSRDGQKILFQNQNGAGNSYHYLYTIDSNGITGFTDVNITTYNMDPRISPDRTLIIYNCIFSSCTGSWTLHRANFDGTGVTNISGIIGNLSGTGLSWYDNDTIIYQDSVTNALMLRDLTGANSQSIKAIPATHRVEGIDY